ncbi:peptide ABC transporter substrate-binding protein [Lysinibacillus telephonicus]|uniref:peptide ABC transporter substrate-binding protein n=1 Tax=Lysinibacillus telephonicus TaxID=1714840 RepID=UPI003BA3DEA2
MKKNNILLLSLLLALAVILAACNFGVSKNEASEKEINLVIPTEPPLLHPQLAIDSASSAILQNVFEGLTTIKDGEVINAVAKDIQVSADLLTYTFTLRDAQWSNGDTVTAGDFAYAWKFALNPENGSRYASIFYPIKGAENYNLGIGNEDDLGIKVVNEKTLEVTLEHPTPYFLELTAFKTYYPIHKASVEQNDKWYTDAGETYITNGPFTLADWRHSSSITLEKNRNYWDAENVALNKVNISIVENEATASMMFDAGEVDFLGAPFQTIGLDKINEYKDEGILNISNYAAIYAYTFNTTGEFTSNANIRKALTLAIDRQGLIDNIIKGEQTPALGMVPSTVPGFEEDRGYFTDNNIKEAKTALEAGMEELGINNPSEIKIAISINTSEGHGVIAQYIQEGWHKNLGIDVSIDNSEVQVFLDKLTNLDYDIGRVGWVADYNDAYTFLEPYDSANNGNNVTGWENASYAALLKKSITEKEEKTRIGLLKQAEAIAMAEFPIAPIYNYTNLYVKKDYVKNMEPNALGSIYLKYVDVDK